MDKLSKEEVLHVGRLFVEQLTKIHRTTQKSILLLFDEIEKILLVNESTDELLISPCDNPCSLRDKSYVYEIDKKPVLANAPDVYEDYIEVRGVFDE